MVWPFSGLTTVSGFRVEIQLLYPRPLQSREGQGIELLTDCMKAPIRGLDGCMRQQEKRINNDQLHQNQGLQTRGSLRLEKLEKGLGFRRAY